MKNRECLTCTNRTTNQILPAMLSNTLSNVPVQQLQLRLADSLAWFSRKLYYQSVPLWSSNYLRIFRLDLILPFQTSYTKLIFNRCIGDVELTMRADRWERFDWLFSVPILASILLLAPQSIHRARTFDLAGALVFWRILGR